MKITKIFISLLIISSFSVFARAINPVLKYSNAGTLGLWTEESYYCSPAVADIDADGAYEIIFSNYSITVLDALTGNLKFRVNSGHDIDDEFAEFGASVGYTWASACVEDIDSDGYKEIITVHGNGLISVLDCTGHFKEGWPQTPIDAPARSVKVSDLDKDGKYEIIVGYGVSAAAGESVYVYSYDGKIRAGWPQLSRSLQGLSGWGDGIYMNGICVSDLDGDGYEEIIVPTDNPYVSVYRHDGSLFGTNSSVFGSRHWAQIAYYEDGFTEIEGANMGWGNPISGNEKREELMRAEFGSSVARAYDVDGDGKKEILVSAIMAERISGAVYTETCYTTLALLNSDRTRFINPAFDADWTVPPFDVGEPLVQNPNFLASYVESTPVVCDLDGDMVNEILLNTYDGKLHCFSLNKTEPFAWPYSLTKRTSPMFEYASPAVCFDFDGDGRKEVVFTSFYDPTQEGLTNENVGSLYILNYEGRLISKTVLPPAKEHHLHNNGAMSAPALFDLNADGVPEIIINTLHGAICVYEIEI